MLFLPVLGSFHHTQMFTSLQNPDLAFTCLRPSTSFALDVIFLLMQPELTFAFLGLLALGTFNLT